eukprot:6458838-Alexandrium_andersonii.AAC.1
MPGSATGSSAGRGPRSAETTGADSPLAGVPRPSETGRLGPRPGESSCSGARCAGSLGDGGLGV